MLTLVFSTREKFVQRTHATKSWTCGKADWRRGYSTKFFYVRSLCYMLSSKRLMLEKVLGKILLFACSFVQWPSTLPIELCWAIFSARMAHSSFSPAQVRLLLCSFDHIDTSRQLTKSTSYFWCLCALSGCVFCVCVCVHPATIGVCRPAAWLSLRSVIVRASSPWQTDQLWIIEVNLFFFSKPHDSWCFRLKQTIWVAVWGAVW